MVKKRKLLNLIRKYIDGTASDKESAFVEKYYRYFDLKNAPSDSFSVREKQEMEEDMLKNIHREMEQASYKRIVPFYQKSYVRIAAVAIMVVMVAGIAFWYVRQNEASKIANENIQVHDIAPGGNKATLMLANGSKIILSRAQRGILFDQGNTKIIKTDSGQLVYKSGNKQKGKVHNKVVYNTLTTPPGGNYRIVLPDGSKVWLNASSSLKFPTAFYSKERKVEVRGEAYFEVKKDDAHPFIVQIYTPDGENMGTVKVLGTHFNINAYMDKPGVKTTLVEGTIKVIKGTSQKLLEPGDQALIQQKGNKIEISKANIKESIAWKKGFFQFEDADITSIMHQIARWYDVEVSYNNKPHGYYSGIISRHTKLSEVLKILEAGGFHFKVSGRKIIVNP